MIRRFPFVYILAFSLLIFCGSAFAQSGPTGTGSIMLSGKSAFSSKGGDLYGGFDDGSKRISLFSGSVSADIFVLSGVALGANSLLETESYGDYSVVTWGIGPEAWLFIGGSQEDTAAGSLYPFLTFGFLYTRTTAKMTIDWPENDLFAEEQESTDSLSTVKIGGGVCYMLTDTIGLIFEVNYEIDKIKFEDVDDFDGADGSIEGNNVNVLAGISAFIH
jgi:hypothetical protein